MVVVGNSHAHHMAAVVVALAEKYNWTVINLISLGCPYSPAGKDVPPECGEFHAATSDYITELKPDAVFVIATKTLVGSNEETLIPGFADTVRRFTETGVEVVGVRDNPRVDFDVPKCAEANAEALDACTSAKADVLAPVSPLDALEVDSPLYTSVDLSDVICPDGTCPPIIGNVYVYIDSNHVSATYWRTMAGPFEEQIADTVLLD